MRKEEAGARPYGHEQGHQSGEKAPAEERRGVVGEARPPPGDHEGLAVHQYPETNPLLLPLGGQAGAATEPEVSSAEHGQRRVAAQQKVIGDPRCPGQERDLRRAVGDPQRHAQPGGELAFGCEDRFDAGVRLASRDGAPAGRGGAEEGGSGRRGAHGES